MLNNDFYLNKYAIITGGANGIGRCIAERILESGTVVHMIDIDEQAGTELRNRNKKLLFFHGDISDQNTLAKFMDGIKHPVDFIINNACISRKGLLSNCTWEDFEYVQRIGVTAPYYIVSTIQKKGLLAKRASIVNISSTRAMQSQADTESYSAAKGGILALTHAMSVSLAGQARVNAISPGWIETAGYQVAWASSSQSERPTHKGSKPPQHSEADKNQHPAGRVGTPEDIAEMVIFLCDSHRAGFITGENIVIDGGMSKLMVYHDDKGWRYDG